MVVASRSIEHGVGVRSADSGILIVDDNPNNLLACTVALEPLGRPVQTALSGDGALQKLLDEEFALILMDVQMPGIDGYETTRLIRTRARNRLTPIIFITAFDADQESKLRAYELGAVDFMSKPIQEEILRAKASVFIELDDRARALREAHGRELTLRLTEQRRELEAFAMREQMAQLERADRKKDEMLAILAHELRGPLAPIVTALDLLDELGGDTMPPKTKSILRRQVTQLTRLVDDMLDISRFATGKIQLERGPLSLTVAVEDALAVAMPLVNSRSHTLAQHPPASPVVIDGDPGRLVQIISNLVTNAAKYTPPGGHIDVAWGVADGSAFVRISDNGRGIPPHLLGRIFEPFVQERIGLDGTGGLGLGLALVKKLVQLHDGDVEATSDGAGRGSTFTIRLPANHVICSTEEPTIMPSHVKPIRAVVIDDHPDLRDLLAELLASHGHEVTTAEDGLAGFELIRKVRPEVALVDLSLPGLDGYEIARRVRAELPDLSVRLVAMSGHSDQTRSLEAGFDAHLVKPASMEALLGALTPEDRRASATA